MLRTHLLPSGIVTTLVLLLALVSGSRAAAQQGEYVGYTPIRLPSCETCEEDKDEEEDNEEHDEKICYGPCNGERPGTLFQWSRCASFEGGPPGRDEPLATDRPDFTEASTTVGLGVAQIETGYTYIFDDVGADFTRSHSFPETLLRVGVLADWLELRIAWNYAEETTRIGGVTTTATGSEDLSLGFKIALTPQEEWLPEMAIIPQMTVPVGDPAFTSDEVLPGLIWIYAWEINDWIVTAGQTQMNRAIDGTTERPYGEFSQSWTIGYSLTDRIGAFTEWFVLVPDGADSERTQHFFNGGFTYLWNNDLQFDIRAGVGLNDAADDYFLGTGFAKRF